MWHDCPQITLCALEVMQIRQLKEKLAGMMVPVIDFHRLSRFFAPQEGKQSGNTD